MLQVKQGTTCCSLSVLRDRASVRTLLVIASTHLLQYASLIKVPYDGYGTS